jgi:hypothetical protein
LSTPIPDVRVSQSWSDSPIDRRSRFNLSLMTFMVRYLEVASRSAARGAEHCGNLLRSIDHDRLGEPEGIACRLGLRRTLRLRTHERQGLQSYVSQMLQGREP